jgi:glycosyltransferase involved in cell wall biosynthesis
MRIVFNLLTTLKPKTGVGQYAARLFTALSGQLDELHAFPTGRLADLVRWLQRARSGGPAGAASAGVRAFVRRGVRSAVDRSLGIAFRSACRRGIFDLYHEPNFIAFNAPVPAVVTVHDLSVLTHPEWHPVDRVRHHERQFRSGLAAARHVLTDSRYVRRQVIEILGVPADRVTAVPIGIGPEYLANGPAEAATVRRELGLPPRYFLYVGTIEPRKNVLTLLRAYRDLPAEIRSRLPLILAGGWGWKSEPVADFLRSAGPESGVLHLGYTADRHLPGLYAGARALVFPSFDEGFGLPPLEMLAAGGAVLSSPAGSLSEVLGNRVCFIDPNDLAGWRDAMSRAATDNDWLDGLRRGGREHAAAFTWERCAAATIDVYRSVLGQRLRTAA